MRRPERKDGRALGLLERLTVCGKADGDPRRGGALTGHCRAQTPGDRRAWVPTGKNGQWGTRGGGPEPQAWLSPGPSPPLLFQSRDRKMVGDITGAQSYASTAKCLNICSLVLGILLTVVLIIVVSTGSLMIVQAVSELMQNYGGH